MLEQHGRTSILMFDNVIAIAANTPTPALNFTLVSNDGLASSRLDTVNNWTSTINHSRSITKGEKHYLQIQQTKSATNPLTGGTSYQVGSVSLSISVPPYGWTRTEKIALVQALLDTLGDAQVTIGGLIDFNS